MQRMVAQHGAEPNPLDRTGLCLLSLDGGGVRGLSTLYILKSLMVQLNRERQEAGLPRVKPCKLFDLIGGTGTGGYAAMKPPVRFS
jgi:patatin-like phospholipase/acyl hydrolase